MISTDDENIAEWTNMMSVVDYERELMKNRSLLLNQLKNPLIYKEFMEFMSFSKSTNFVLILNVLFIIVFLPPLVSAFFIVVFCSEKFYSLMVEMLLVSLVIINGWLLYGCLLENSCLQTYGKCVLRWTGLSSWKEVADYVQAVLYISSVTMKGFILVHRTWVGECKEDSYLYSWACNPGAPSHMFPLDSAVFVIMIPVIFTYVLRETRFRLSVVAWGIALISIITSSVMLRSYRSFVLVLFYSCIGGMMITDSYKQHLLFYLISRQLKKTIETNQRLADLNKATEMRHMIANVAHDLKTPLSSFMTGIDIISSDVSELDEMLKRSSLADDGKSKKNQNIDRESIKSFIAGVQTCIFNVRNTNAFMMMTINRCLDYTKASNGLKLVPKNETIDFAETLSMPLQCMTNIQNKIKISLLPYEHQKICSHIITDKQWLQENVLCLLSNAVKYSAGGEVSIRVKKLSRMEGSRLGKALERSSPTDKVCGAIEDEIIATESDSVNMMSFTPISGENAVTSGWIRQLSTRNDSALLSLQRPSYSRKVVPTKYSQNEDESETNQSREDIESGLRKVIKRPRGSDGDTANITIFKDSPRSLDSDLQQEELMFEVIDSGIGMTEEAMKSLFNPFKQTQRLAGGTGLGLYSLAKRIEALRGKYGVHQREDKKQGSVFWFTVPYKPDEVVAAHAAQLKEEPSTNRSNLETPKRFGSIKSSRSDAKSFETEELSILLAEDTPSIAKMTAMLLRRQKHRTDIAENGQIALDKLFHPQSVNKYDVVLMDLQMPVMDGLEATRRIRANEQTHGSGQHRIVIGVSANSDYETMEEALKAGADDFLPKPFSVDAFTEVVRKVRARVIGLNYNPESSSPS